jgi:hypothetical protein
MVIVRILICLAQELSAISRPFQYIYNLPSLLLLILLFNAAAVLFFVFGRAAMSVQLHVVHCPSIWARDR